MPRSFFFKLIYSVKIMKIVFDLKQRMKPSRYKPKKYVESFRSGLGFHIALANGLSLEIVKKTLVLECTREQLHNSKVFALLENIFGATWKDSKFVVEIRATYPGEFTYRRLGIMRSWYETDVDVIKRLTQADINEVAWTLTGLELSIKENEVCGVTPEVHMIITRWKEFATQFELDHLKMVVKNEIAAQRSILKVIRREKEEL